MGYRCGIGALLNPGDEIVVSAPVRFHLNALSLTFFDILEVVVDACAIFVINRLLVLSACIGARVDLCCSAARKRKRANQDKYPGHDTPRQQ